MKRYYQSTAKRDPIPCQRILLTAFFGSSRHTESLAYFSSADSATSQASTVCPKKGHDVLRSDRCATKGPSTNSETRPRRALRKRRAKSALRAESLKDGPAALFMLAGLVPIRAKISGKMWDGGCLTDVGCSCMIRSDSMARTRQRVLLRQNGRVAPSTSFRAE